MDRETVQLLSNKSHIIVIAIIATAIFQLTVLRPDLFAFDFGPIVLAALALACILSSFSSRGNAINAWVNLFVAHILIIAAVVLNVLHLNEIEIVFYLGGVALAFILGLYCLQRVRTVDNDINLNRFHGYVYEQRNTGFLFLLSAIGLLGFPVTAAFIGIDVFFTYIGSSQYALITLLTLCFIFVELAAVRIYLRIFLGPHKKLDHPVAFRTS